MLFMLGLYKNMGGGVFMVRPAHRRHNLFEVATPSPGELHLDVYVRCRGWGGVGRAVPGWAEKCAC